MSSLPERIEKRCLNCESLVYGRYCQVCGQENVSHHVGFFHLVRHFVYDIFHFDGKFINTLKSMFARPGQAAKEYVEGKRARHLDPVKMYVFTSAIFFLLFFKLWQPEITIKSSDGSPATAIEPDSAEINSGAVALNISGFDIKPYPTLAAFDSAQRLLPAGERQSGIRSIIIRKSIHLREKFGYDQEQLMRALSNDFLHRLPQALFVTLPIFALLLKLLYTRHKKWQYFDHGVFSIHIFVSGFIVIFLCLLCGKLAQLTGLYAVNKLQTLLTIALLAMILLAMRRFYGQAWGKTVVKWLLLMISATAILGLVLLVFLIFSLMNL